MEIPNWAKSFISKEEFDKVEMAIQEAESKTSGEIVPLIVRRSSTIDHVRVILMLFFIVLLVWFHDQISIGEWGESLLTWIVDGALLLVAWGISNVLSNLSFFQRLLTSEKDRMFQVNLRAEVEFYEAGLDKTEGQTGILLFISLMEHKAVVLADKGIASHLPPETWNEVVKSMTDGIRAGQPSRGLVESIEKCETILEKHFPIQPEDKNELRDHLIIKD